MYKIAIIGSSSAGALEYSYKSAFEYLGHEVLLASPAQYINRHIPLKKFGQIVETYIGIESWEKKGNRELALSLKDFAPQLVLVFCNTKVLYGTLAFLRSVTKAKFGLLWPDTLFNLTPKVAANSKLYDFVGTYSSTSVAVFEQAGFNNVFWLPLAADSFQHNKENLPDKYSSDISFIGGWRPEREQYLKLIRENFQNADMLIKGPEWLKRCKIKSLRSIIDDGPAYGNAFAGLLNSSRINLNIIDDTNYPAANMRFFEIPVSKGLQLSSSCPEFENEFKDGQSIEYFSDEASLLNKISKILSSSDVDRKSLIDNAYNIILDRHTYNHRAKELLKYIQ